MVLVEKDLKKRYVWVNIMLPGIYHSSDLGLISLSSDGSTRLTIADKNIGATSTDISEVNSRGNYFQWGNNYAFPQDTYPSSTSSARVDASAYGPGNYYSSSIYRVRPSAPYGWDTSNNKNLWGMTTDTYEARRGPCSSGYHIPSEAELNNLITLSGTTDKDTFCQRLLLPQAGYRNTSNGGGAGVGTSVYYRSSDAYTNENSSRYLTGINDGGGVYISVYTGRRSYGMPIRPFKNEPVIPDDTWTIIYQPS